MICRGTWMRQGPSRLVYYVRNRACRLSASVIRSRSARVQRRSASPIGVITCSTHEKQEVSDNVGVADHHSVYVVYLKDPKGDGRAAYYVGMTGLTPEERFLNHKAGLKAARVVKRFGVRLVPKLYAHLNPMPYKKAVEMEVMLADSLRKRGYMVYGGH